MPYTNKEYFLGKIKESALNNLCKNDAGAFQEEYLTKAIADADSLIDSYLASAITLPLATVPESVKLCSYNIAMNIMHGRIQYNDIPEFIAKNKDDSIAWLKDVAKANVNINVVGASVGVSYDTDGNMILRSSW